MITLYHGSNVRITDIDLKQCNPYKDFGQAFYLTTEIMNISEQEFKYLVEGITSDLIQLLIDRVHHSLPHAVEAVYGSNIYAALLRPTSGLYSQSSGYVYSLLESELKQSHLL